MKKLITLTLLLATTLSALAVPKLPSKVEVGLPKKLSQIVLKESDALSIAKSSDFGQKDKFERYWIVYSDRDNNTTYEEPSTSAAKCSSLKFNEKLIIAQIKSGFALVYTDPQINSKGTSSHGAGLDYPQISEDAQCRGWVPMSKLLLWSSCLADEHGIYSKALLCINLDAQELQKGFGVGYRNPEVKENAVQLNTDMNFYFIMKREKNMALLATQYRVDGSLTDQVLFCWVPEASYVPWNQRSCLEPTWKAADVEYFAAQKREALIYKSIGEVTSSGAKEISTIKFEKKQSKTPNQYLYRMAGSALRFPILDEGNSTIYNMSTFSTMFGEAAGTGSSTQQSEAEKIQGEALKKQLNINLAIVIDGTSSMEPYYPAVRDAIKEGCAYFSKNNRIRVGIIIYRDYTDGEQGLVEMMPMTDIRNIARMNEFLDNGGTYGIRSAASDKTQTEALYYGINEALDKLDFRDGESNMMLVVGDCGNDPADTQCATREEIVAKLVSRKVQLMGFQVQNKNIIAFNSFNNQMLYLIRNSFMQQSKSLLDEAQKNLLKVEALPIKNANDVSEGYNFKTNLNQQFYISNHRFADAGVNDGKMDPAKLTQHIKGAIAEFAKTVQSRIDVLANAKSYFGSKGGAPVGPGNMDVSTKFIEEMLGPEWKELISKGGNVINFRGFTSKKDESGRDFFKPVIFISQEEFHELLKKLAPVAEAASQTSNKDRTPYIEAMKALLKASNPGLTDADMAKLSNDQMTQMIGGLNEPPATLERYTLDDLGNSHVIKPEKYDAIVKDFTQKYNRLRNISRSKTYEFIKEFNSAKYYWIPVEDLP
ncbi:MAG: hypothetical protein J6K81_02920 [Rikenellaceae bacterium]|nr:hypothetical protein [Rikenellaceae bacterium]